MAIFKSADEKAQIKQEKELKELQKFLDKYNLEQLEPMDLQIVKKIATDLAGNGMLKTGMALSFAKAEDQATVTYLSALVEQNWLIINQLSRLNKNIENTK